jgi:hypothetical protein
VTMTLGPTMTPIRKVAGRRVVNVGWGIRFCPVNGAGEGRSVVKSVAQRSTAWLIHVSIPADQAALMME